VYYDDANSRIQNEGNQGPRIEIATFTKTAYDKAQLLRKSPWASPGGFQHLEAQLLRKSPWAWPGGCQQGKGKKQKLLGHVCGKYADIP
jgi:hypothetical protein